MKKMTYLMCCLTLGSTAMVLCPHAKAQSDEDKQFLTNASQADINEIKLSELAEQKATNPDVKAFAEKMVKDHHMLEEKMKPYADQWGITPATNVDADHQRDWDKLNGLSGKDFDKQYMADMMSDHTKAYSAFTKEVKDTHDAQFKATVEQGKSVVAAHKNEAWSLKKKL